MMTNTSLTQSITAMLLVLWCAATYAVDSDHTDAAATLLLEASLASQPIPVLSKQFALNEQRAYEVQKKLIDKQGKAIYGYKAGLTSKQSQARFGASQPVMGVLLSDGVKTNHTRIALNDYTILMLETELGFVIGRDITQPIKTTAELKEVIECISAVVELPDLGFAAKELTVNDIIAANVAAKDFIVGPCVPTNAIKPNQLTATLTLNDTVLNTGQATDAMGDQWQALLWLVNTALKNGYTIQKNHLFITGSLGKMRPAKTGDYVADFGGQLGSIAFRIK